MIKGFKTFFDEENPIQAQPKKPVTDDNKAPVSYL
jgi:hypothetical protein